jgi:hypothetical protein
MLTWAAEVGSTRDRSTARYEQRTLSQSHPDAEVADAVGHGDHCPTHPVLTRPAIGHKVVHELLLTRSPPGIGVSVIDRCC